MNRLPWYDASDDVKHDVINDVIHAGGFVFTVYRVVPLKICVQSENMCRLTFGSLLPNIAFFHIIIVSALDVRIEMIEDDGSRDIWTFQNDSLKSTC